jgi:hypothetical protein
LLYEENAAQLIESVQNSLPQVMTAGGLNKHRITVVDQSVDNELAAAFSKSKGHVFARTPGLNKKSFGRTLTSYQAYAKDECDVFIMFDGGHSHASDYAKREFTKAYPKCVTSCIDLIPREADQ